MARSHTTKADPTSRWRGRAKQGLGLAGAGFLVALHTEPPPLDDGYLLRPENPEVRVDNPGWGSTGAEAPFNLGSHLPTQESARTTASST